MRRLAIVSVLAAVFALMTASVASARGFGGGFGGGGGGMRAGGMRGGGFGGGGGGMRAGGFGGGGGFSGVSYRAGGGGYGGAGFGAAGGGYRAGGVGGGFSAGGVRGSGEFGSGGAGRAGAGRVGAVGSRGEGFGAGTDEVGGFRAGGATAGGARGEGYSGAAPSRGQLNSFLGLPTDAGMSAAGTAIGARGAVAGPDRFAAGRAGAAGVVREGPNGTTVARGAVGARGVAAGPGGAVSGGGVAGGTVVRGPDGNVYARGGSASRVIGFGPGSGTGGIYSSATYRHSAANSCDRWAAGRGYFTPAWTTSHPWAWAPAGYAAAAWSRAVWAPATWGSVAGWVGWDAEPAYYDYGNNVTYQDNSVYYGEQPYASSDEYAQQAATLASSAQADGEGSDQWLPLGVFGLMKNGQKAATLVLQIAVNHLGTVRGNAYDPTADTTAAISGAVDKATQRVAISIKGQDSVVIDTGLYNLTQGQAPALLHTSDGGTESDLLVRMKDPSGSQTNGTNDAGQPE